MMSLLRRRRRSLCGVFALLACGAVAAAQQFGELPAGDHPFIRAFLARAQGGEEISGTSYQYGYVLRTALYRRK